MKRLLAVLIFISALVFPVTAKPSDMEPRAYLGLVLNGDTNDAQATATPIPAQPTTVPVQPTATATPVASTSNCPVVTDLQAFRPRAGSTSVDAIGAVKNTTSIPMEFVKIQIDLTDSDGQLLARKETYADMDVIPTNEFSSFASYFTSIPSSVRKVAGRVIGCVASDKIPLKLDITSSIDSYDELDFYHIKGVVRNSSNRVADFAQVFAFAFDADNNLVGVGEADLITNNIAPGGTASFDVEFISWIPTSTVGAIKKYLIYSYDVYGGKAPSSGITPTATPVGSGAVPGATGGSGLCTANPNASNAPNSPVRILTVNKAATPESVVIKNISGVDVDVNGWRICSITGNQIHAILQGTIGAGVEATITSRAIGLIWNNNDKDDGALYNANGELISYWIDLVR